ncbi:3-hydroxyacyl-CoA dehydrogenase NAD-binding domain-containing protein, partial [Arthrobacter sp. H14]|uniref:3-hydroxyacyl-CoA dehydrogenase NAD-binding domain-containing protein n=1 Tax=Arthrobacter sp. H14 TaxID=1312959 RepID=UPI0020A6AA79
MSNTENTPDAGTATQPAGTTASATQPTGTPIAASVPDVGTVACVGAGTIGGGWAAYFLARGYQVKIWDPSPDAGPKLRQLIDAAWPALTKLGLADGADPDNFSVHTDLAEAVEGAGFIQESAPEVLELKQELLAKIDAVTAPGVVIASSTSGYSMTEMATTAADPSRLVVGH